MIFDPTRVRNNQLFKQSKLCIRFHLTKFLCINYISGNGLVFFLIVLKSKAIAETLKPFLKKMCVKIHNAVTFPISTELCKIAVYKRECIVPSQKKMCQKKL